MPDIFDDLEAFHMPEEMLDRAIKPGEGRAPRFHVKGESFLKGPIPWANWLRIVKDLPGGKTWWVALSIWYWAGIKKSKAIKFSIKRAAEEEGLHRNTIRRALRALERAGLISVQRGDGKAVLITIQRQP